jgi:lysophospholipase L1-like esterase
MWRTEAAEPASWQISVTDSSYGSGYCGLNSNIQGATATATTMDIVVNTIATNQIMIDQPASQALGSNFTVTGVYYGAAPTAIDYAYDATSPGAWSAVSGLSASGGTWSGTVAAPGGTGLHCLVVRDHATNSIQAASSSFNVTASNSISVNTPGTQTQSASYSIGGSYTGVAPTAFDYSYNGGSSWTAATAVSAGSGGWTATATAPGSPGTYQVMVRDHNNTSVTATSGNFTVGATPTINVNTPGTVTTSATYSLSGTYGGTAPTGVDYSYNGGSSWTSLPTPTISGGNWSGTATAPSSPGTYSVMVRESNNTSITATSSSFVVNSGSGTIAPNNSAILYSPYNWDVTGSRAFTICSGAYLRVLFSGNSCGLTFNTANLSSPQSQIWARIDDGPWTQYTVASSISLTIPAATLGNTDFPYHLLQVVMKSSSETLNRWNSPYNTAVQLTGIVLDAGATVLAPLRAPRNLLIYGDSITEGVRTVGESAVNDTDRNDALVSYAYALGDLLGAEVGVVGFGATGINQTGSGNVPGLSAHWNLIAQGISRVFTPQPDMIIINQGSNDGSADTTAGMTSILNNLLSACPNAAIVASTPMRASSAPAHIIAAIAACNNPQRVRYLDTITVPYYNTAYGTDTLGYHPNGPNSVSFIAPKFAAAVAGWFPGRGAAHY